MKTLILLLSCLFSAVVPMGKPFLKQLQPRDSILVADQLEYGFTLEGVKNGTGLALPNFEPISNDTLTLVQNWRIDTLKTYKRSGTIDLSASIVIAPFEVGTYHLPELFAQRTDGEEVDTLSFEPIEMLVTAMPIDTATFVIHDIKGQIKYPLTFAEVLPWGIGALVLGVLLYFGLMLLRRLRSGGEKIGQNDPPYVVALRKLDHFRGDKFWAPEKQKAFYSGVTDALKEYMDARFGIDAPEMTTAELFAALKGNKDIESDTFTALKDLFERADFVKFARMTASDTENATVLPLSVKFVTDTYQSELKQEEEAPRE